jgi:hypothetical protein
MDRPTLTVGDIVRRYGEAYRRAADRVLSTAQRRVITAVAACRTAALGRHVEPCDHCGHTRVWYNSCRNRHCPGCQSLARAAWIEDRTADLLDCEYFHVVFTVPQPIAEIAAQNKAVVYGILFHATADTLHTIAADPRHLGATIGFVAVLHTWGQTLMHHPHLHCVVPGGGLSPDGTRWIACRPGFFLPVRVLSRLFRRLFLESLPGAFETGRLHFAGSLEALAVGARPPLSRAWVLSVGAGRLRIEWARTLKGARVDQILFAPRRAFRANQAIARDRSADSVDVAYSSRIEKIFPGFMRSSGSSARLIARMTSTATSPCSSSR